MECQTYCINVFDINCQNIRNFLILSEIKSYTYHLSVCIQVRPAELINVLY